MLTKNSTIIILGIFISISLSCSELYYGKERIIQTIDTNNHILASISALKAIKSGQFPIRVTEGLIDGLGYPFHQFYSPLTHTIIAVFSLLNDNIFTGLALSVILMMTIAFIFSFKLIKYLTFDSLYGLTGAFLYVCAPYLTINRVGRGAYAEFFAICLLPCFIYCILRVINKFNIIYWCLNVIILACLYNIHLITSFYLLLFSSLFFLLHSLFVIKQYIKVKKIRIIKRLLKRLIILFSIVIFSLFLSAWSIIPIIFYKNINIKYNLDNFFKYNISTTLLSLLSITDAPHLGRMYFTIKLQTGFLLNLGLLILIIKKYKDITSLYLYPILITQISILFLIISPFLNQIESPIILSFAQFPYRFIAQYQLLGIIIAIIAFKLIIDDVKDQNNRYIFKNIGSVAIIILSIILISPYLYRKEFAVRFPIYKTIEDLNNAKMFMYQSNTDYQFNDPTITPNIEFTDSEFLVYKRLFYNSQNQIFTDKLENYSTKVNYNGTLDFDIMYYPGLQDIYITINGQELINPNLSFFKRIYGVSKTNINESYYLYGLRVNNLPKEGIITVHVIFRGSHVGNIVSVVSLIFILIILIKVIFAKDKKINLAKSYI